MVNASYLRKPKIILVPYPAQGHVTPMMNLASAFLRLGFHPVVVIPEYIHRRMIATSSSNHQPGSEISLVALPDGGLEPDDVGQEGLFFAIEKSMENVMPFHLERLLLRDVGGGGGKGAAAIVCVVVDLLATWAVPVARLIGVPVAGFWPAMLATYRLIEAIPELIKKGVISRSGCPLQAGKPLFLPNQPTLYTEDLPWLIGTPSARKGRFKFWKRTLERSRSLPWLLLNSFSEEYHVQHKTPREAANDIHTTKGPKIFKIGPLNSLTTGLTAKINPSFWEEDRECLKWLDQQNPGSVVYVSFGSWVPPIGHSDITELALSLESSNRPFLWVLAPTWRDGLPRGFSQRVNSKSQGMIVSWAPQMEVLQNDAVGCYLTHCGWNSTGEAVRCRRRMLCYPVAGDQFVNCGYICEVWKVGLRIGGFGEREIVEGLKKVMEDEREEMDERMRWLRKMVMGYDDDDDDDNDNDDDDDDADRNAMNGLDDFVDELLKKHDNFGSCLDVALQDFVS